MTLDCDIKPESPSFTSNYTEREQLVLANLPIEGAPTYKRMMLYTVLKIVEVNPNISENNIVYNMNRFYGYDEKMVSIALTALSSNRVFPLLRRWKNSRMRRGRERFFIVNEETSTDRVSYLSYLENTCPEFKALSFNKHKGL